MSTWCVHAVDLITAKQWEWARALWNEGYLIKEIAAVLGLSRSSIQHRIYEPGQQRIGAVDHDALPPIQSRLKEVYQWWDEEEL